MQFSEIAWEILEFLRETHRRPGARVLIEKLDARFGTDPAVVAAISELAGVGYVSHPDANTIEITAHGFDALQRRNYEPM
jgi:hypothetical protein